MRISKSEREAQKIEAVEYLRSILPAGSTVSLVLSSVSRSGMSRNIKCLDLNATAANPPKGDTDISCYVARALGLPFVASPTRAVRIGGCGMDMGLALIDALSYALYGKPIDQSHWDDDKKTGGLKYAWL